MQRHNLVLVVLTLVESLLVRWALLDLEEDSLKRCYTAVLVFEIQSSLPLSLLLKNANVIALNLFLQVLRVKVFDRINNVLLDIL